MKEVPPCASPHPRVPDASLMREAEEGFEPAAEVGGGRAEREAVFRQAKPAERGGVLDRDRVDLGKQRLEDRSKLLQTEGGAAEVALLAQPAELAHFFGQDIGADRDHTARAELQCRHGLVVVSGVNVEIVAALRDQLCEQLQVPGSLLDPADAVDLCQLAVVLHRERKTGAGGDIVDDHRAGGCLGNGAVVEQDPAVGCLVVIGGDRKKRVGTGVTADLCQPDRAGGAVGATAGEQGDPTADDFMRGADQLAVLVEIESGALSGCARDQYCGGAGGDLPFNQCVE